MALLIASVESSFGGLALTPELAKARLSEGVLGPFLGHPGSQVLTHSPGCFEAVMHKMLALVAPLWLLPRAAALAPVLFSFAVRVAGCYKQYPGYDNTHAAIAGIEGARQVAVKKMVDVLSGSGGRRTEEDSKASSCSELEYYLSQEHDISQAMFTACEKAMKDFYKLAGAAGGGNDDKPGYVKDSLLSQKQSALDTALAANAALEDILRANNLGEKIPPKKHTRGARGGGRGGRGGRGQG